MADLRVAIAIVNRNMPALVNNLGDALSGLGDVMYVLENGSDRDKVSKHANILISESNGVSWAVNHLIKRCADEGYDAVWVNYNDAWFDDPKGFLDWAKDEIASERSDGYRIGVVSGYWPNVWDMSGAKNPNRKTLVSFFDPLSFVVSADAVKAISAIDKRLTPFWDSTNYTAHYNILGPAHVMYSLGYAMIVDPKHTVKEIDEFAAAPADEREELSVLARGFSDSEWKTVVGPRQISDWMSAFYPGIALPTPKAKRDAVIKTICETYKRRSTRA